MTIPAIILGAAKTWKVSGALLLAICTQESSLTNAYVHHDGGSPSIGVCQLKYSTAKMVGFRGKPKDLMNPVINANYAAKYLAYQSERYGANEWVKLAAAYNAGSYNASSKLKGCPRNVKYVRFVKKRLPSIYHHKMICGQRYGS